MTRTRRVLMFFVVISTLISIFGMQSGTAQDDIKPWRSDECRFGGVDQAAWTVREIKLTMDCAIDKWSVPGGFDKALDVALCESGADLKDPGGDGYAGTFQQSERYWSDRQSRLEPRSWDRDLSENAANPRANVVVSIRMAHASGWERDWKGCS